MAPPPSPPSSPHPHPTHPREGRGGAVGRVRPLLTVTGVTAELMEVEFQALRRYPGRAPLCQVVAVDGARARVRAVTSPAGTASCTCSQCGGDSLGSAVV